MLDRFWRLFQVDISEIKAALAACDWAAESYRAKTSKVHKHTMASSVYWDADYRHRNPSRGSGFELLVPSIRPLWEQISGFFNDGGYVIRTLFARLPAGKDIVAHSDNHYSLLKAHRLHIPIVTNPDVLFSVGGEAKRLLPGEVWEIDNSMTHAVQNAGTSDRIHLIVDWVTPQSDDIPWPTRSLTESELIAAAESAFAELTAKIEHKEVIEDVQSVFEKLLAAWVDISSQPVNMDEQQQFARLTTTLWFLFRMLIKHDLFKTFAKTTTGQLLLEIYEGLSGVASDHQFRGAF